MHASGARRERNIETLVDQDAGSRARAQIVRSVDDFARKSHELASAQVFLPNLYPVHTCRYGRANSLDDPIDRIGPSECLTVVQIAHDRSIYAVWGAFG